MPTVCFVTRKSLPVRYNRLSRREMENQKRSRAFRAGLPMTLFLLGPLALTAPSRDPNNPTGAAGLVLIDKLGHFVRFFDPTTFKEISSVEVGVTPHDLAIS